MQYVQFKMEASAAPAGQASNQSRLLSAFQVSTSCGLAAAAATNAANCLSSSLPIKPYTRGHVAAGIAPSRRL